MILNMTKEALYVHLSERHRQHIALWLGTMLLLLVHIGILLCDGQLGLLLGLRWLLNLGLIIDLSRCLYKLFRKHDVLRYKRLLLLPFLFLKVVEENFSQVGLTCLL